MFYLPTYPFFSKGGIGNIHLIYLGLIVMLQNVYPPSFPPPSFRKKLIKLQTVAFVINMACFHDIFALDDQKISE